MIITRYQINKAKNKVKKYFINQKKARNKSKLYKIACFITRSKNIKIDYERKLINNIYFITDIINNHWAETDGNAIYINNVKNYNKNLLYYTILHECLHGFIKRNDNSELSEVTEHKLMYYLDKKLI